MVFKYTEALALDLRMFAKHGKRAVVGVDDVKLLARKDPKMVSITPLVTSEIFKRRDTGVGCRTPPI